MREGTRRQDRRSAGERRGEGAKSGAHRGRRNAGRRTKRGEKRPERGGRGGGGENRRPSTTEWVVGAVCGVLVLCAIGYLAYHALARRDLPPVLAVRVERIVPTTAGHVVEVAVRNEGSETAANVSIEGTLLRGTAVVERSTATLDFVPAGTEREGGLLFTKDPGVHRLELRATGFDRP